jgi:tripartite-type tricarboxylate transporter receptor subunit TctC
MQRRQLISLLATSAVPASAFAQSAPMRIIVPFGQGGATDIVARLVADALGREMGRPAIVENRAGAGGSLGTAEVARAAPDGLTLGIATVSTHGVNPVVYKKLAYDPVKDFAMVSELALAPGVLLVNPALPVKTMAELIQLLKREPAKHTHGSPGIGSVGHMNAEILKSTVGVSATHVPYLGASPMINDLISGQIDMAFDQVASALPHIKAGRLRPLAVSWKERLAPLPEVPTFGELALFANNDPTWFGLVAPARTPAALVQRLNAAVRKVLALPEVKSRMDEAGLFVNGSTPAELAQLITKTVEKMRRTASFARISLDN